MEPNRDELLAELRESEARAAAGSLEIESPPGDGTRVRATIPL